MSTAKFDVERFTGENDFGLWRLKMRAVLMQQGVWDYVKSKTDKKGTQEADAAKAQEMEYKAYSSIVLCLSDRVLREVQKEDDAAGVWEKLEKIYMEKSISNRLHLKQRLFNFRFSDSKNLGGQLEEFRKCIDDLESVDDAMKDEDKALMLLNALPPSFEQFKDSILLGRDSKVTLEEVFSALKLKGTQKRDLIVDYIILNS